MKKMNKLIRNDERYFSLSWEGNAFLWWDTVIWMKSGSAESVCAPNLKEGKYSEKHEISLGVKKLRVFVVKHFWLHASMNFLLKEV